MTGTGQQTWRGRALTLLAFLVLTASRAAVLTVVLLTLWAVAPTALGWHSTIVQSGSMAPGTPVGSILVVQPGEDRIVPGAIVLVDRPGQDPLSHRVLRVEGDTVVTKGDANRDEDSTPWPKDSVQGAARFVVPVIGQVLPWWQSGAWLHLGLAAAVLLLSLAVVVADVLRQRSDQPRGLRAVTVVAGTAVLALLGGGPTLVPADAVVAAVTANPGNSWATGAFGAPTPSAHVVGTTTGSGATAAMTMSLPVPAGLRAGDVLVATLTTDMAPSYQPPGGWARLIDKTVNSNARVFAYHHVVSDPTKEPAAYSWSLYSSQTARPWNGVLTAVRGVDNSTAGTPVATFNVDTTTGTTLSVPMTGSTGPALLVSGVGADTPSGGFTPPDRWTEASEASGGQGTALAYRELPAGGGSGTVTWGRPQSGGAAGWVVVLPLLP